MQKQILKRMARWNHIGPSLLFHLVTDLYVPLSPGLPPLLLNLLDIRLHAGHLQHLLPAAPIVGKVERD